MMTGIACGFNPRVIRGERIPGAILVGRSTKTKQELLGFLAMHEGAVRLPDVQPDERQRLTCAHSTVRHLHNREDRLPSPEHSFDHLQWGMLFTAGEERA